MHPRHYAYGDLTPSSAVGPIAYSETISLDQESPSLKGITVALLPAVLPIASASQMHDHRAHRRCHAEHQGTAGEYAEGRSGTRSCLSTSCYRLR